MTLDTRQMNIVTALKFAEEFDGGASVHEAPDEAFYALDMMVGLLREELAGGWRPIATAPRDGTQILLWWDGKTRLCRWREAVNPPKLGGGRFANWVPDDRDAIAVTIAPTHWQPLPAGPQP